MAVIILNADARAIPLPDRSVQCVITSPPYWGLRNYGHVEQIGLEKTPEDYVAAICAVFDELWRVLRDDGTVWLNLGDSYARGFGGGSPGKMSASNRGSYEGRALRPRVVDPSSKQATNRHADLDHLRSESLGSSDGFVDRADRAARRNGGVGYKSKDLVGIPWIVAFALRTRGWYLRSDIIWAKPNPMPESVTDRPTRSHEYIFLLTKQAKYYYDAKAVMESAVQVRGGRSHDRVRNVGGRTDGYTRGAGGAGFNLGSPTRNRRSVWWITTKPFSGAHFATFPPDLVEPCLLAGCPPNGRVLDPFGGSGTVAVVARQHGRSAIVLDRKFEYCQLAVARLAGRKKKVYDKQSRHGRRHAGFNERYHGLPRPVDPTVEMIEWPTAPADDVEIIEWP